MPHSRQRNKHHHHAQQHHAPAAGNTKAKRNASVLMAIIFGVFGLAIGTYAGGKDLVWIIGGAILGILVGYFVGSRIDKTFAVK